MIISWKCVEKVCKINNYAFSFGGSFCFGFFCFVFCIMDTSLIDAKYCVAENNNSYCCNVILYHCPKDWKKQIRTLTEEVTHHLPYWMFVSPKERAFLKYSILLFKTNQTYPLCWLHWWWKTSVRIKPVCRVSWYMVQVHFKHCPFKVHHFADVFVVTEAVLILMQSSITWNRICLETWVTEMSFLEHRIHVWSSVAFTDHDTDVCSAWNKFGLSCQ